MVNARRMPVRHVGSKPPSSMAEYGNIRLSRRNRGILIGCRAGGCDVNLRPSVPSVEVRYRWGIRRVLAQLRSISAWRRESHSRGRESSGVWTLPAVDGPRRCCDDLVIVESGFR